MKVTKLNFKTTCNNVFYNSTVILHSTVPFVLKIVLFSQTEKYFLLC